MKKSLMGLIGIEIDEEYKWKESIVFDDEITSQDESIYIKCKQFIKIKYSKKIDFSESRKIDNNIYGCEKYIYDSSKKTKIYFEGDNICVIESNQEVNEWLMIMVALLLLKENVSFIHAAAVSNEDGALLLPSWGGVGKTASVAKLVRKGYKLLGDDINIITKDGDIYPLPKKFVLYFYHRDLFPEVFKKKGPRCNSFINNFYECIKPVVKTIFRKIPGLLAYSRKHNPQSSKVSPIEIFGKNSIGEKTKIKQSIWIEREIGKTYSTDIDYHLIATKAMSVTLNEIFGDNLQAVFIMNGFNIINSIDLFDNMRNIYLNSFKNSKNFILNVSKGDKVERVADEVIERIEI